MELGGELKAARMAYEEIWEGALATVDVRNGWQMWAKGLAVGEGAGLAHRTIPSLSCCLTWLLHLDSTPLAL